MPTITFSKGFGPKCPNHGCPLVDMPFPPVTKGEAVCPVSGAHFTFEQEIDETEMVKDANGNMTKGKKWKLTGDDK